eukprot:361792-Rhodomonas_salina.1
MPLFFITLTCSKEWAEFRQVLTAGQEPSDSPVWTSPTVAGERNSHLVYKEVWGTKVTAFTWWSFRNV